MWKFGERIPANQLADITEEHQVGPIASATLPLYHHAGTYPKRDVLASWPVLAPSGAFVYLS